MDDIQLDGRLVAVAVPILAALAAALLILALRPWLVRYALARPNARSAHTAPTPQGGGLAVVAATLLAAALGAWAFGFPPASLWRLAGLGLAALLVGLVGIVDDIRPLPPLPRLGLQILTMAIALAALPAGARALPGLPLGAERLVLVIGGAWFINLTNFMDGMDWLTVVGCVPITAALALFWSWGFLSPAVGVVALALLGGLLGFAPFNRPIARLFLGDVGSLPIGLLVAVCLIDLAAHGALAAALLLPLYAVADSGITLIWRLRRGDRVWEAHRLHYYQVAVARGFSVADVLTRVFAVNLALAVLAGLSLSQGKTAIAAIGAGVLLVGWLLRSLAAGRPR